MRFGETGMSMEKKIEQVGRDEGLELHSLRGKRGLGITACQSPIQGMAKNGEIVSGTKKNHSLNRRDTIKSVMFAS